MDKTWVANSYETELGLDGDGLEARRATRDWDTTNNIWGAWKASYYLRSSILNQIVSETTADGRKWRSYIFGRGEKFANQTLADDGTQSVVWRLTDVSGNSIADQTTTPYFGFSQDENVGAELDPLGNNVGTKVPENQIFRVRPDSPAGNAIADTHSQCTIGGISGPCSIVEEEQPFFSVDHALPFQIKGRSQRNSNNPLMINNDINREIGAPSLYYVRGGEVLINQPNRSYNPQFLNYLVGDPTGGRTPLTPSEIASLRGDVETYVQDKKCNDFISAVMQTLIGQGIAGEGDSNTTDILSFFDNVFSGGVPIDAAKESNIRGVASAGIGAGDYIKDSVNGGWLKDSNGKLKIRPTLRKFTLDPSKNGFYSDMAFIGLKLDKPFGSNFYSNGAAYVSYRAETVVHELFHVFSSSNNVEHSSMAMAAYLGAMSMGINNIEAPPAQGATDLANSEYFDGLLKNFCDITRRPL